jgi:hypothetical protein
VHIFIYLVRAEKLNCTNTYKKCICLLVVLPKKILRIIFMHIAPSPLLVRQSHHYRVVSFLVVLRCMKTDGRITTSYMTTNQAHTQCDPISAFDLTFFASCYFWVHVFVCTSKMFTLIFRIHIK